MEENAGIFSVLIKTFGLKTIIFVSWLILLLLLLLVILIIFGPTVAAIFFVIWMVTSVVCYRIILANPEPSGGDPPHRFN